MIGTSIPIARAAATKSKYTWLSKKSWVIRKDGAGFDLLLQVGEVGLRSGASGCTSGKQAPPSAKSQAAVAMKRGQLGGAAEASLGLDEVPLAARRVPAQGEDVLDPRRARSCRASPPAPRVVSPTQLRWAIVSKPSVVLQRRA